MTITEAPPPIQEAESISAYTDNITAPVTNTIQHVEPSMATLMTTMMANMESMRLRIEGGERQGGGMGMDTIVDTVVDAFVDVVVVAQIEDANVDVDVDMGADIASNTEEDNTATRMETALIVSQSVKPRPRPQSYSHICRHDGR